MSANLNEIHRFLLCPTPLEWVECALENPQILLIDHANCEKKAAGTALNLMYRYVENIDLLKCMSRLAREELRHFEQVIAIMQDRGIPYRQITASRYAAELRKEVRTSEPGRLVDTLIVGAVIEARSCERFAALAPRLDGELASFYLSLLKSEARHFRDYLNLAAQAGAEGEIDERSRVFLEKDKTLIQGPDEEFRFHSGVCAV